MAIHDTLLQSRRLSYRLPKTPSDAIHLLAILQQSALSSVTIICETRWRVGQSLHVLDAAEARLLPADMERLRAENDGARSA